MSVDTSTLNIGVDVGGTFTDAVAVGEDGSMFRAKSATTPGRHVDGIMNVLTELAMHMEVDLGVLLERTSHLSVGTTVVTNAIAELRGRRVGLLVTKGFRDTLKIARSPRVPTVDPFVQAAMPVIVPNERIVEIDERVDAAGTEVVPLSVSQVLESVRILREEQDVEAIAICYLWSFLNPSHEAATRDAIARAFPDLFVTASSDLYPVIREYERMVTTCLNAFVSEAVASYARELDDLLQAAGFSGRVYLGQSLGGVLDPAEAEVRPLHLFNSGPVGGVAGAIELARELDISEFITADMGGTSYDVSLVRRGKAEVMHRAVIDRFETGISQLDITPVGAGGGSICWIDDRGAPRVGPRSAGADPGPVCYGRGGQEPTVTDIAAVLGLVDSKYFLGGAMSLEIENARTAVADHLGSLGGAPEEIAGEMYRIVVQSMIQAVRTASIRRGRDPRGLAMFSFGGASGLFSAEICRGVGIPKIIIPEYASVFSAYGLLRADPIRTEARSIQWFPETSDLAQVNSALEAMRHAALDNMKSRGFAADEVTLECTADMRFSGQSFDIAIPLPFRTMAEDDRSALVDAFRNEYSAQYGPGSVWAGFSPVVTTARVVARAIRSKPAVAANVHTADIVDQASGERSVYLLDSCVWQNIPVWETERIRQGRQIDGPCIVENLDTTIFIPEGAHVERSRRFRGFEIQL